MLKIEEAQYTSNRGSRLCGNGLVGREAASRRGVVKAPQQRFQHGYELAGDDAVMLSSLGAPRQRPCQRDDTHLAMPYRPASTLQQLPRV